MPYNSDKQRRFFHTDTAKKAGITSSDVEEWDKASKGMKLPEHAKKMAEGGDVSITTTPTTMSDRSPDYPSSAMTEMPPEILAALISRLIPPLGIGAAEEGTAADSLDARLAKADLDQASWERQNPSSGIDFSTAGRNSYKTLGGDTSQVRNISSYPEYNRAPKMEEDIASEAPKIEAYIKGIQKNPKGADIKIWGVKGDPKEIAKLGFGEDPGSIPEQVLRDKGILPTSVSVPTASAPNTYADGGTVNDDSDGSDWKDKLATVLKTMFNSPAGTAAQAVTDPIGTLADKLTSPDSTIQNLGTSALPVAQNVASAMTSGAIPQNTPPTPPPPPTLTPQSQTAQNAVMPADLEAAMTPKSEPNLIPQSAQAAPKPSAMDLIGQLTNNDNSKMQALLSQLKDQDKRSQFAQALGVIGDTLGNIGMAKAGMRPEGITTPQMLSQMNQQSKEAQIQNLTASLASDPNSQTSKMAQMTLMQSMGISPNDPRAKQIQTMPAQAITQLLPQMTDAVKNNIEKERNLIQAKEADYTHQMAQIQAQIAAGNLTRENTVAMISNLNDIAKNAPIYRPDMKNQAMSMAMQLNQNLSGGMGQTQPPMYARNSVGHRIRSTDGGHSWMPVQ